LSHVLYPTLQEGPEEVSSVQGSPQGFRGTATD